MKVEKRRDFIINFCYFALILVLIYLSVKYLVPAILPIIIALIIAVIFKGPINKISQRRNISRSLTSVVVLAIFYSVFIAVIVLLVSQLLSFIKDVINNLPSFYINIIEPILYNTGERILIMFPEVTSDVEEVTRYITDSLSTFVFNASESITSGVGSLVTQIPSVIINALFTTIASFFFTVYYHDITDFIFRQLSEDKAIESRLLKRDVIGTIWKYIKSYAKIMSFTLIELTIGMIILGIPNPLAVSAIISLVDILPILGVGTVLIPWSIVGFIIGNYKIGFGVLILYIIITVIRQSIEPKIIGDQIGLHPVMTLVCIFIGGMLFGIIGVFLLPITAAVVKKLHDDGKLNWVK